MFKEDLADGKAYNMPGRANTRISQTQEGEPLLTIAYRRNTGQLEDPYCFY